MKKYDYIGKNYDDIDGVLKLVEEDYKKGLLTLKEYNDTSTAIKLYQLIGYSKGIVKKEEPKKWIPRD